MWYFVIIVVYVYDVKSGYWGVSVVWLVDKEFGCNGGNDVVCFCYFVVGVGFGCFDGFVDFVC